MRRSPLRAAVAACAILATTAGAAGAFELTSSWLSASGPDELRCRAVNTGKKPVTVLVELVGESGENLAEVTFPGCDGTLLAPNQLCSAYMGGPAAVYCRITTKGKQVRGAFGVGDPAEINPRLVVPVTR
jgi:hypothetical protein